MMPRASAISSSLQSARGGLAERSAPAFITSASSRSNCWLVGRYATFHGPTESSSRMMPASAGISRISPRRMRKMSASRLRPQAAGQQHAFRREPVGVHPHPHGKKEQRQRHQRQPEPQAAEQPH